MSLINKLVLKIYANQLKDVDNKQKGLVMDDDIVVVEDIPYVDSDDKLYMYDYIYSKNYSNPRKLPLIINIHGGAFTGGDKLVNRCYCGSLSCYGFQVATVNYHYAPLGNLKKQVQDCVTSIREILRTYNKNEFYLVGDSSGSVLVLLISLLWNNMDMQKAFEIDSIYGNIIALGLIGTQGSIDMFPKSMKIFNKENRRIILDGCLDIEKYTDIRKMWNNKMPPIYIMSAYEDVCYNTSLEFDKWLDSINHPHKSYYCKKHKDIKLYHCFNVIRPDMEYSVEMNKSMIDYFKSLSK